jgi:hypothetical protein
MIYLLSFLIGTRTASGALKGKLIINPSIATTRYKLIIGLTCVARAFSTSTRAASAGARKSLFAGAAVAATAGYAYYQSTVFLLPFS